MKSFDDLTNQALDQSTSQSFDHPITRPLVNSTTQSFNHSFIGNPPTWLMRSGITIIAFVLTILLIGSYFIKYPDKITSKGVLTAYHPPIDHFVKTSGVIDSLFITDGMKVEKGSKLLYIENDMNVTHLNQLMSFIDRYENIDHIPSFISLRLPYKLQMGELSDDYGRLVLAVEEFQSTLKQAGTFQQINTLKNEIVNNKKLQQIIEKDKNYTEEELALIEKDFGRNSSLNKEGVISDLDKEKSKGQLLQYQKTFNQTDQSLISNQIKNKQLELEIQRLTEERSVKVNDHIFKIKNIINDLRKNFRTWEETYYLKSKIDGMVNIKSDITKDRYISPELSIATIIPKQNSKEKYAKIIVPSANVGKITKGTSAIIRLDAYPYKEYGILKSKVRKISLLPDKDKEGNMQYEVHLALKEKMTSTYNYDLPYQPMASISADVITEDKSILERIFSQFLSLVKNE